MHHGDVTGQFSWITGRQVKRSADYVQMKTAITNTILTRSRQSIKAGWSRDQRDTVAWRVSCCKQTSTKIRKLWLWVHNSKSTYSTCYSGRMCLKKSQHVFLPKPHILVLHSHISRVLVSRVNHDSYYGIPSVILNSISILTVRVHYIRLIFQRKNTLNI